MKNVLITAAALGFGLLALEAQAIEKGNPERGQQLSTTCAACHGPDGNSPTPQFPRIAGQYADYMVHTLKAYKSGQRKNPIMAGITAGLSEQDMEDLAAYFSRQQGNLYNKSI
ncbi:MAG TPA: cytochrome c [Gammaproteobacteria bacterium]|nr:cytochrome c [Gammaproteobacteria bacterium]